MRHRKLKHQLTEICHRVWQKGWVAANDGNISAKLPNGTFLATPTGVSKLTITPEMLINIDENGNVLDRNKKLKPSSEIKMHLRCYKDRPDVNAVVHAHPPVATGFAVAGVPLDNYSIPETIIVLGSIPITPYGTPSTDEVPNNIAPYIQKHDVVLLQNHGALALGADLMTAYYRMETLELFAQISLNAHILGGTKELSEKDSQQLISMRAQYGVTGRHPGIKRYSPR
ncbi:MAG: class II aldolase/adducin family protein [Defluviitaleaceae bacterium]|nr:class II aldolase/adducin family protein [Defluviitaleaceae bacterium]